MLPASRIAVGLKKGLSASAPDPSNAAMIALQYSKAHQEHDDSSARTDQQGQGEHGQEQARKDSYKHTVNEGDHASRREEDLPPEWVCPHIK
jgi:hypothetical protein